ncbi:MAG: hypothetical protein ABIA75_03495 [Candidatus Neomarinimicrobiota bacterium]
MITFAIDEKGKFTRAEICGEVTHLDIFKLRNDVLVQPGYRDDLNGLCLIDREAIISLSKHLFILKDLVVDIDSTKTRAKWAIVMPHFFLAAAFVAIIREFNLKYVTLRFFQSEEQALEWLRE